MLVSLPMTTGGQREPAVRTGGAVLIQLGEERVQLKLSDAAFALFAVKCRDDLGSAMYATGQVVGGGKSADLGETMVPPESPYEEGVRASLGRSWRAVHGS